jgi:hypothetical protein
VGALEELVETRVDPVEEVPVHRGRSSSSKPSARCLDWHSLGRADLAERRLRRAIAIELAAARLRVLSVAELADRLDDQLTALARGPRTAPGRQQTLRATFDWSYDLLDDDERVVFRRVAIFAGDFRSDAAEQVVADDRVPAARVLNLIERLVERSLLTRVLGGAGPRLRMLEPVRQYAAERLDNADERDMLARRHLEWVADFAQRVFSEFLVSQHDSTVRIRDEHPNVGSALEFALGIPDVTTASKIIATLCYPWHEVGQPDGRLWCERVLAALSSDAPLLTRGNALIATAMMLQDAHQYDVARSLLLEALELFRSGKHVDGEAVALNFLGWDAYYRDPASAETKALFEEALSRYQECEIPGENTIVAVLAEVALHAGDDALARQRAKEAVNLGTSSHVSQAVAAGLRVLAILDSRAGDFESSDRHLAETIAIEEAAGARAALVRAHATAAELAPSRGNIDPAAWHLARGADLAREMQTSERVLELVASAAYVAYKAGRAHDAAVLFGARLGSAAMTFPKRFRPILEELENQGHHDEIAAAGSLRVGEVLEHVLALMREQSQMLA